MAYISLNKAHTHHKTTINGQPTSQYSRYETGIITGNKRNLPAILADSTGSDGYGFDSTVGSDDDSWHVLNAFDSQGGYIDTIAVGGAMDSDHAVVVAQTQLDSLGASSVALIGTGLTQFDSLNQSSAGTFSIDALNKLMDNPSQDKSYLPVITASELAFEADRVTFDSVQWADNSNDLLSHDGRDSTLMLDMTRADTRSDLVNDFELADVLDLLGAEPEQAFDALMDTKNRLPLLKDRLFRALARAGDDKLSITNVVETKPFKRQGVTNIAFVFDLSDGQKLSIWFHNPDSTPSKLMPSDIMISWKWMLNKRDVTAALSPKQGDNVQLPTLASRIMRVAAKNSMRFKRTQASRLKLEQDLLDAQALIDAKNTTIEQLDQDIASLNSQIDAAMKAPINDTVNESGLQTDNDIDNKDVGGIVNTLLSMGLKFWEKQGKKRIYMTCAQFNQATGNNLKLNDNNNKIFFDFEANAIMRSYKGKKPAVEIQYEQDEAMKAPKVEPVVEPVVEPIIEPEAEVISDPINDTEADIVPASEPLEDPLVTSVVDFAKTHAGFNGFVAKIGDAEAALEGKAKGDWVALINDDGDVSIFMVLNDNPFSYTGSSAYSDVALAYNDMFERTQNAAERWGTEDDLADIAGRNDNNPANPNNKKIVKGKSNKAKTPKGTKIESVFALVDAKFLIASHTANGSKNPKYPQELQPRDRARESSIAWVQKTSRELDPESLGRTGRVDTGAPIVGDDLVVESGNGRTIAIKMAYANGDASEYREWLAENADMFGMTAKQVESYKQPILVRMRTTQVNRSEFAVEANQDDKLSFTASERAKSDAKRVNAGMLELFDPSESGDILAASNRSFVKSFLASLGATEAAQYTDSNGNPTQALVARIKGALFSKAYDDDRLLEMMADQTKPELQNTLNALTMAAPKFVAAQAVNRSDAQDLAEKVVDSVEQSLSDEVKNAIVDATNMIMNAKLSNQDIKEYVLQQGLFEQVDDATAELAVFLAANARSAKKMTDYFNAMASYIEQDSISRQNLDMFGEPERLSLADVIAHANNQVNDNTDTIGTLDMFNETVIDEPVEPVAQDASPLDDFNTVNLAAKVDGIVNEINSSDFDPEIFDVDALSAIEDEAEGNSELTAKLEAASEVYQNKLMTIAMQAMSDMAGN